MRATAKDNRLFVEAVLYRYRAGITWRDLPLGRKKITRTGETTSCATFGRSAKLSRAVAGEMRRKMRAFILKSKIAGLISSLGSKRKLRIDKICGLLLIYLPV